MANDNRDRDDRKSDNLDEPIVAVPVPLNNTGSGYIPAVVPAVGLVREPKADDADAERDEHGYVPAGYDSADDRIDEEFTDHLTEHSYIDTTQVTFTVKDGKVTLEGSVPNADQKDYVEEVAARIDGVTGIDNKLTVQKPQGTLLQNTFGKQ
jgi:hypothetical protein